MSLFENILLTVISISFNSLETTITFRFVLLTHVQQFQVVKIYTGWGKNSRIVFSNAVKSII